MKTMSCSALLLALLLLLAACDSSTEEAAGVASSSGGLEIIPLNLISGGFAYLRGEAVADSDADSPDESVVIKPLDGGGTIEMPIARHEGGIITLDVPDDLHERIPDGGKLVYNDGEDDHTIGRPVFATENSGFGGRAGAGMGLLGNVYTMIEGGDHLPTAADWCDDAVVLTDGDHPCPFTSFLVDKLDVPVTSFTSGFPGLGTTLVEWFAIRFAGFLQADTAGDYTLKSCSDDGTRVYVETDGGLTQVVENDGIHGMGCVEGQVTLDAGLHELRVEYFQGPATQIALQFYWVPPGGAEAIVPAANLFLFADY